MCDDIINSQIRICLVYKHTLEYSSNGGLSLTISDAQGLLFDDTGIKEKEHNIRNSMVKLTELPGFTYHENALKYESEKQKSRRLQAERDAELRSAEETAQKALAHLELLRKKAA